MDIYSTRAQLAAIEQQPREYSFLYDLFVQEKGCVEDNKAIYDYRKGTRRMAPIVHENTGGILMERTATRPVRSTSAPLPRSGSSPTPTWRAGHSARRSWGL